MSEAEQKRLDLIHNERTKLTATYLNGLAVAVFATGSLATVIATLGPLRFVATEVLVATLVLTLALSISLHQAARMTMADIR